jgi:hypothetical protein
VRISTKPSGAQVVLDHPAGGHRNSEPAQHRVADHLAVVGDEVARDANGFDPAAALHGPAGVERCAPRDDAVMVRELVRRRRRAVFREVRRCGAEHATIGRELERDEAGVDRFGDPYGDVDALVKKIDLLDGEVEIDRHLRVEPQEFR